MTFVVLEPAASSSGCGQASFPEDPCCFDLAHHQSEHDLLKGGFILTDSSFTVLKHGFPQ